MLSDDELKRYRELLNAQNDSTYFKKEIGANLKNARANTPLTQEDVAEIFDCDPRKIRRYENGEVMCSLTQLISFCKVYKCTLEDLMPAETISYVSLMSGLCRHPLSVCFFLIQTKNLSQWVSNHNDRCVCVPERTRKWIIT